jgi:succinate-semialdehyde dehydrogenase/glutarate-semialdehyde dehydrogenase
MTNLIAVRNPYTGEQDYSFTEPSVPDIMATCERLRSNQPAWARLSLNERIAVLNNFSASIARHREALVAALVADTGRTQVAAMEIDTLDNFIQRTASEAPAALANAGTRAARIPIIQGTINRVPYGLVGNISPWNFPVILSFLDTFPALVSGNAVVIKPSEVTPRWVEPMRAVLADCPELAAVLDIVVGSGVAGATITDHVDAVVFTGSVATGKKVAMAAARNFIPAFLELGGKDPAVILESADIALAARTTAFCSVQSTGQACQSLERVYVARKHFDRFVEQAVATAESLQINYPDIAQGLVGPFIFEPQAAIVMHQLAAAKGQGAHIHCGGELLNHGGFWMRPTVVTGVDHTMQLMQEETFGPVMPIMPFDTAEQALELANDSQYGLSAAVFAGSLDEGQEFAAHIRAGAVSVNDAALTVLIHEFEHHSFGYSGLGASRAGGSAYTRFTREQSIMSNTAGQPILPGLLGE